MAHAGTKITDTECLRKRDEPPFGGRRNGPSTSLRREGPSVPGKRYMRLMCIKLTPLPPKKGVGMGKREKKREGNL